MPNLQQTFTFAFAVKGLGLATRGLTKLAQVFSSTTAAAMNGLGGIAAGLNTVPNAVNAAVTQIATPIKKAGKFIGDINKAPTLAITKGMHMLTKNVQAGVDHAKTTYRKLSDESILAITTTEKVAIKGNRRIIDTIKKHVRTYADGTEKVYTTTQRQMEMLVGSKGLTRMVVDTWMEFATAVRQLDRNMKLFFFPFKFAGKIMTAPFRLLYNVANKSGKVLNTFIVRPLRMVMTISRAASKGFKMLGSVISTAFSVGLGPIGLLLKLFSPLLEMVAKFLEPAFEAFEAAIEAAFGPLDFVIEMLMQQLAPLIAETIKPFAAILIAFIAETAPKLVSWLTDAAKQAAPLAAQLAEKLVPAMQGMVENVKKFVVLYGPDILALFQKVWDFWANFESYMKKFQILFIDPIIDGIKGIWKTVEPFVQPIFDAISKIVNGLQIVKDAKAAIGIGVQGAEVAHKAEYTSTGASARRVAELVKENPGMSYKAAQAKADSEFGSTGAKKMAAGGIVVGEAGPEAIIPLRADAFAEVLGPLMTPGFNAVVAELQAVRRLLQGTITVQSKDDGSGKDKAGGGDARAQEDADLGLGVGMVPAW